MINKNTPRRRFYINFYFWAFATLYFTSQAYETIDLCVNYKSVWDDTSQKNRTLAKVKHIFIVTTMLICHILICYTVLPEFRKQIKHRVEIWYVFLLSFAFIGILLYREYINLYQDNLKMKNQSAFNAVFISYFACFELLI